MQQPQTMQVPILEYKYRAFVVATSDDAVSTAKGEEVETYLDDASAQGWILAMKNEIVTGTNVLLTLLHHRPRQSRVAVPPKGLLVPMGPPIR